MKKTLLLIATIISFIIITACDRITVTYDRPDTEVTSDVIEVIPDYSNMPSYCNPKSYKILRVPIGYVIQYPGGTISTRTFKTASKAQEVINGMAKRSKQRWLDSGGTDF